MKFLENFFKNKEHLFEHGGKYEKFHPMFHAIYSFMYNNHFKTTGRVHVRDSIDTKRYMTIVIIGLLPLLVFGIYNAGLQNAMAMGLDTNNLAALFMKGASLVLPIVAVSYGAGLAVEFLSSYLRGHAINEGFLVTGMIFPLTLPVTIPLWQVAVGVAFGVIVGKEIFGGTGRNFLNPALTARAFVFFSYPANMSGDIWTYVDNAKNTIDGFSGATALSVIYQTPKGQSAQEALMNAGYSFKDLFLGFTQGSIGETSFALIMLCALWLLLTKVANWRTIVSGFAGAIVAILIFNYFGSSNMPASQLPFYWHLVMGGFAFAIIFIATDPVSSPYLNTSKLIYGFLIGFLGMLIRVYNAAYVESWMLIILLMNVFAPFIDHYVMQYYKNRRIANLV